MTGWVQARMLRTAVPASVAPVGGTALMPPHSQGAERRTDRHTTGTGSRWALRALVIGGLAGAAWLLTGAAAHAADTDPAPGGLLGPSLIGAVVDGASGTTTVGQVLHTATRPLEADRPAKHRDVTSTVLSTPARVLSAPVKVLTGTLDEATQQSGRDSALGAVDQAVQELPEPIRLTGGPAESPQLAPVAAPHTDDLPQVTDQPQHAAPVAEPVDDDAAATRTAEPVPARTVPAIGFDAGVRDHEGTTGSVGKRHSTVTVRHPAAVTAATPDIARDTTPGSDGPEPLQVHLGALSSGISTSGSGAPAEGGSAAFLPAAVAGSSVAHHRLITATDVEVRRHDAEAPTVSPD
jgi:hypothetical protein